MRKAHICWAYLLIFTHIYEFLAKFTLKSQGNFYILALFAAKMLDKAASFSIIVKRILRVA